MDVDMIARDDIANLWEAEDTGQRRVIIEKPKYVLCDAAGLRQDEAGAS